MTVGVAHNAAGLAIGTGLGAVIAIIAVFAGLNHAIPTVGEAAVVWTCIGVDIVAIVALFIACIDDAVPASTGSASDTFAGIGTHCATQYAVVAALGDGVAIVTRFALAGLMHAITTIACNPIDLITVRIADGAVIVPVSTGLGDGIAIITLFMGRLLDSIPTALRLTSHTLTGRIADGAA